MKAFNVLLLSVVAMMSIGCAAQQPRQKAATVVKVTKVEVRKAKPVEVRRAIPVARKVPTIASDQPAQLVEKTTKDFQQQDTKAPAATSPAVVTRPEAKPVTAPSVAKKPSLAEQGSDRFHRLAVPVRVDSGVTVFWVAIGIAIVLAAIAVQVVERHDEDPVTEAPIEEVLPEVTAKTSEPPTEKQKRKRAASPGKPKPKPRDGGSVMSAEAEAFYCYEAELDRDIRMFAVETTNETLSADARELAYRLLCGEISIETAERELAELEERDGGETQ